MGVSRKFYPSATTCTCSATHATDLKWGRVSGVIELLGCLVTVVMPVKEGKWNTIREWGVFCYLGMGMEMDGIEVSESGVCFHDNRDGFGLIL